MNIVRLHVRNTVFKKFELISRLLESFMQTQPLQMHRHTCSFVHQKYYVPTVHALIDCFVLFWKKSLHCFFSLLLTFQIVFLLKCNSYNNKTNTQMHCVLNNQNFAIQCDWESYFCLNMLVALCLNKYSNCTNAMLKHTNRSKFPLHLRTHERTQSSSFIRPR